MNIADELHKLDQLHKSGALSDDEFARAKSKLLDDAPDEGIKKGPPDRVDESFDATKRALFPGDRQQQARQWAMFLHMSLLANYVLPMAGVVAPILIWQLKKDEFPSIDEHGKNAVNWIISETIYLVIALLLSLVIIGIPMVIGILVVGVIFPMVAGIKANNGEVWKYPMTIAFIK